MNIYKERNLLRIGIIISIIIIILLQFSFYREETERDLKTRVEHLQEEKTKLKLKFTSLEKERDSINTLIILNLKENDEKIIDIINMPDSTKVRILSNRYGF